MKNTLTIIFFSKTTIILQSVLLFSGLFFADGAHAQLSLPSIFSDKMVLQQGTNVALWGKSAPNKEVLIESSWNNKKYKVVAEKDSLWRVRIETPGASYKEYFVSITSGGKKIILDKVLIGEVWLCAGQSNMEQPMKGKQNQPIDGALKDIALSSNNNLRCYTVRKTSSVIKIDDTFGNWEIASPNTTKEFSATAYYFGRLLQQVLNIPVGLIHCSWGGSPIEAWMSSDAIKMFPDKKLPVTDSDNKVKNKTPTVLFNGMLHSVVGYGMKGVIWYQGETNRADYANYPALFKTMHADWITKWRIGDFPFYFCQIAPYGYKNDEEKNISAFMREAQSVIAETQKNTGIAVLLDAGEEYGIHPANKKAPGERLAYVALGKSYGFDDFEYQPPKFNSVMRSENKLIVLFDYAENGFSVASEGLRGFEIAGEDRVFYPAKAKRNQKTIELISEKVQNPVAVRYAFKNFTKAYLFGTNGLPVSSFRSDNWDDVR